MTNIEDLVPTVDGFWQRLGDRRDAEADYTGPTSRTLADDWTPDDPHGWHWKGDLHYTFANCRACGETRLRRWNATERGGFRWTAAQRLAADYGVEL